METNQTKYIGIDPGTTESGYCIITNDYEILVAAKIYNADLLKALKLILSVDKDTEVAIESIQSYGMQMGKSTIETCYMIGRIIQIVEDCGCKSFLYPRPEYAKSICATNKISDAILRTALLNRFGSYDRGKKQVVLRSGVVKQVEVPDGPLCMLAGESDKRSAFAVVAYHLDKKRFSN